jgi:hypothetical protein
LLATAIGLVLLISLPSLASQLAAQTLPGAIQPSAEPSIEAKIAELKAAKTKLAREARQTMGYHESLRQMKIVKIDKMIKRLENGENIPQSKIDHTLSHMGFPLYNPNG